MKLDFYDGPNKVKKRWAIGLTALVGIIQTVPQIPVWVGAAIHYIGGIFLGS